MKTTDEGRFAFTAERTSSQDGSKDDNAKERKKNQLQRSRESFANGRDKPENKHLQNTTPLRPHFRSCTKKAERSKQQAGYALRQSEAED